MCRKMQKHQRGGITKGTDGGVENSKYEKVGWKKGKNIVKEWVAVAKRNLTKQVAGIVKFSHANTDSTNRTKTKVQKETRE